MQQACQLEPFEAALSLIMSFVLHS